MSDDIRVGLVRVDQITFHPHNVRHSLGDLRALANSIKRYGVMQPVVVETRGESLRLRAGHRRVAAAKMIKLARIPAVIHHESLDDDEWIIASIQENEHRSQLRQFERRRAVEALLRLGCSREGCADAFGVSSSTISHWVQSDGKSADGRAAQARRNHSRLSAPMVRKLIDRFRTEALTAEQICNELESLFADHPSEVPVQEVS